MEAVQSSTRTLRVESLKSVLLCIDDNELVLECYKEFLQDFGFEVLTASSGRKGLELAVSSPVDLVLLDYEMPELDGLQVAAELRRIRPGTPIILLSGVVDIPAQMLGLVDGFVRKGDMASRLVPAIVELIEISKSLPQGAEAASDKMAARPHTPAA